MSNLAPLLCLFCNHCNVASAKYCNECASPLHLQPCNHCRAIDNRTAIACYKCGAEFDVPAAPGVAPVSAAPELASVPAAPELDPAPATPRRAAPAASKRARVPAASKRVRRPAASRSAPASSPPELAEPAPPVPESAPAPILEDQIAKPSEGGSAIERAILSRSPAAVSAFRQGLRRDVPDTQDQTARVADWDATSPNPDRAQSAVAPQAMNETEVAENLEMSNRAPSPTEREPIHETVAPGSFQDSELAHSTVKSQPFDQIAVPESSQYPVLVLPADEPRPMDEALESEWAVAATGERRARRLVLATLLLAAAALGYYYYDRSAQQLAPVQSERQPTPSTPDAPVTVSGAAATTATQVDATSAPADAAPQITTGAEKVEEAPSPAAPVVTEPPTESAPASANQPRDAPAAAARAPATPQPAGAAPSTRRSSVLDAGVTSRKGAPLIKECTEAVAALGLCSPSK